MKKELKIAFHCTECGRLLGYYVGESMIFQGYVESVPTVPKVLCLECYQKLALEDVVKKK